MRITYLNERGIHPREIAGVKALCEGLPKEWYGYASLELVEIGNRAREVDVALVLPDRIVIVDLKDWHGSIRSDGTRWSQNGRAPDGSPVQKIALNAKVFASALRRFLLSRRGRHSENPGKLWVPTIQGCVVLTGSATIDAMPDSERNQVFQIDEFITIIQDAKMLEKTLPDPGWVEHGALLEKGGAWRDMLNVFFTGGVFFKPQDLIYADNKVCSAATYSHPAGLYEEFDTQETNPSQAPGLLRSWDFSKADTRFHSLEGRSEIAGREREVLGYLTAGSNHLEGAILRYKASDADRGMHYWEVFERRRELKRLSEFVRADSDTLTPQSRRDLIRVMLSHFAAMHGLGATHEDIGGHSIWLALPASVRLSHFMSSRYPETRTLGDRRYQFLSHGVHLPEDTLGGETNRFGRDVFLLGLAAHRLAFGIDPTAETPGQPPEWQVAIDSEGLWTDFHTWFATALDWDPASRFADATVMLDNFLAATVPVSGRAEAMTRLENYRLWPSLFDLTRDYPVTETRRSDAKVVVFSSAREDGPFLVKCWRPTNWAAIDHDAPRLAAFCDRAEALRRFGSRGIVAPTSVAFIPEGLILVQPLLPHPSLTTAIENQELWLQSPPLVTRFLLLLCETMDALHIATFFHGDLSPSNVIVKDEDGQFLPLLVDLVDFGSELDGDLRSSAYTPSFAATYPERDRFATLKIADDLLSRLDLQPEDKVALAASVQVCRDGPPRLLTLKPLIEALQAFLHPQSVAPRLMLNVAGPALSDEPIDADDGAFGLVADRVPGRLLLFGVASELIIDFHNTGAVRSVRRRPLAQSQLAWRERRRLASFKGQVECRWLDVLATEGLAPLFAIPEVAEWIGLISGSHSSAPEVRTDYDPAEYDADVASLEATLPASEDPDGDLGILPDEVKELLDTRSYWLTAIEVEAEQHSDVVVEEDSTYSRTKRCHMIRIGTATRALDYHPDERVSVRRLSRGGRWSYLGRLVNAATSSDALGIATDDNGQRFSGPLCRANDTLRLESLWEADSRRRRHTALRALAEDRGSIPRLADFFDTGIMVPNTREAPPSSSDHLQLRYGLNHSQALSMANLPKPLALLQGPPGTGKTRFIAAFIHHALTTGLARNVLLTSQSHEAVNTAAEGVVGLFRKEGLDPSLVRVGQEGSVSSLLKPFHSARIEEGCQEKFRSKFKKNLWIAASRMGLPEAFTSDFIFLTTTIRPIVSHLASAVPVEDVASSHDTELRSALARLLASINLTNPEDFGRPLEALMDSLAADLIALHHEATPEHARRLGLIAELGRDWLNTVSGRHRNFESFLVATRRIVCGTCVGVGSAGLAIAPGSFDLVVVDEAARCAPGELAIPMLAGKWVVLVGDHKQIEPHVDLVTQNAIAARLGCSRAVVARSDFERAFAAGRGKALTSTLTVQYRMLPDIGNLVSECFYGGTLVHGRHSQEIPIDALCDCLPAQITWIDTGRAVGSQQARAGHRMSNKAEARQIVDLLRRLDQCDSFRNWLVGRTNGTEAIGIICMYATQRDLIKEFISATPLSPPLRHSVKVATVDGYQGKENEIVILSLVRNNSDGRFEGGSTTIAQGFMSQPNRVNVAMSRARDRLVIVGSIDGWPADGPLGIVSAHVRNRALLGEAHVVR